ncbi:PREDICTED: uncharacterized protein LOC105152321 [Acromyrmex echinatior]|uniref:uncharacterized protein LOC105152321 n=1 Tax=Acromyrmex echinatior TaxID=103372 RepID=UPI000580EB00|nr:PREDICTED: uncharacterized protein LOC105152321 [Acromyrmex echinatior]
MQDLFLYCIQYILTLKVHLFRAHKIFHDEDTNRRNDPIWRYFTEEERYALKCKICDTSLLSGYRIEELKRHLKCKHPQIIEEIQKEFEHSWVSIHFILNTSNGDLGIHSSKHGTNKNLQENTGGNDMNMNHQSEENNE